MDTIVSEGAKLHTTSIDVDGKEIRIKTGRMAKASQQVPAKYTAATQCFWSQRQRART